MTTPPAADAIPGDAAPATPPATVAPTTAAPATTTPPATAALPADVAPTEAPTTEAPANCKRLTDFSNDSNGDTGWVIVNDGVMGGGSSGFVDFTDSSMTFTGTVVTQGGGFTSVRLRLAGGELADSTRIEMRVRSDARTYALTLGDGTATNGRRIAYGADLTMDTDIDADGWTIAVLDYDQLTASIFGQPISVDPFDPAAAQEFGIIIADGIDGDFALEVDSIDACR